MEYSRNHIEYNEYGGNTSWNIDEYAHGIEGENTGNTVPEHRRGKHIMGNCGINMEYTGKTHGIYSINIVNTRKTKGIL